MGNESFQHLESGIANEACSPEFICGIHDVSKRLPQLNTTGDNFSVWERDLKVMIGSLTGSCNYLTSELQKHHPKFNRAVFNLIFWSIHEELRQELNIEGSAGEAFQFLANQFHPNPSVQCIMSRAGLPVEILERIVEMIYYQSFEEKNSIEVRKLERLSHAQRECWKHKEHLDSDHYELPILNTFQNLAVVNRKFHKLCLPKLWQHIRFPSALPAPMSIWTEGILLRHGHLVESCEFELEDRSHNEDEESGFERSIVDNKAIYTCFDDEDQDEGMTRNGIGAVNIEKIFKDCPSLKSVEVKIPTELDELDCLGYLLIRLNCLFGLVPQLQDLVLRNLELENVTFPRAFVFDVLKKLPSLVSLELFSFKFGQVRDMEDSLGWNLAQHQSLRKIHLNRVTCESDDRTWSMHSWPQRLTTLEISSCKGLKAGIVQKLLSGSTPYLTRLQIRLSDYNDDSEVEGQTKLPALEQLILGHHTRSFDLLASCQGCKNIQLIEHHHPLTNNQWNLVKHLLSTCTWPKLSVLHLCNDDPRHKDQHHLKKLSKTDVDEIWDTFKIKLLINPNTYVYYGFGSKFW